MLKLRKSWIAPVLAAVGAIVAGIVLVLIFCPVYVDVCDANKDGAGQNCEPHNVLYFALVKFAQIFSHAETWTALFTLAIAYFTFTLKRSTDNLWRVTDSTLKHAETTAERQLRAYVLHDKARIKNLVAGQTPLARAFIKNFGQTPAYNLTHWAVMVIDKFPTQKTIDMSDPPGMPVHHIGPKARLRIDAPLDRDDEPIPSTLTQEEVDALKSGKSALYVYGRTCYVDCLGKPHHTEYCVFTGGPLGLSERMGGYHHGHKTA